MVTLIKGRSFDAATKRAVNAALGSEKIGLLISTQMLRNSVTFSTT